MNTTKVRWLSAGALFSAGLALVPQARAESSAPDLATGYSHTCARTGDASLWCWGSNDSGQLGDGTTQDHLTPQRVSALGSNVAEVSAGDLFTCARKTDGTLWCWGNNVSGQLGDGTTFDSLTPLQVTALGNNVAEVSAGDLFACARKTDGTLWCWGSGFLGNGAATTSGTPAQVTALGNTVAEVSTGDGVACARKTDGTLWCWGDNTFGAIGDGTTTTRPTPVQVTALGTTVTSISVGDLFACASKSNGSLWCWGNDEKGSLGDGASVAQLSPVAVTLATSVASLSANGRHACARGTDNNLACWGWNVDGELGDGTVVDRHAPVASLTTAHFVTEVSAGANHDTCARYTDGTVWCWGLGFNGQVSSTPIKFLGPPPSVPAVGGKGSALLAAILLALGWLVVRRWRRPFVPGLRGSAALLALASALATGSLACEPAPQTAASSDPGTSGAQNGDNAGEDVGSVTFALDLGGGAVHISSLSYQVTGGSFSKGGTLNVGNSTTLSGIISGIPAGQGYTITLSGTDDRNKLLGCQGTSAPFSVAAGTATSVAVHLTCHEKAAVVATLSVPISAGANVTIAVLLLALGALAVSRGRPRLRS